MKLVFRLPITVMLGASIAVSLTSCAMQPEKAATSPPAPAPQSAAQLSQGDVELVNNDNPGEALDVKKFLKAGKYTVVEFTSDY